MLNGQCHEMDIFFECLNISITTFSVCFQGLQGFLYDFTESHVASRKHCQSKITALGSLKRATGEGFSKLVSNFKEAS